MRTARLGVLVLMVVLTACTKSADSHVSDAIAMRFRHVLENPDKFEFLTVACPDEGLPDGANGTELELKVHGDSYRIVDSRDIEDKEVQEALIDALYKAIELEESKAAACFEPHHGVRVSGGGTTVTILVCFICNNFHIYPDGGNGGKYIEVSKMKVWREQVTDLGMLQVAKTRCTGGPP